MNQDAGEASEEPDHTPGVRGYNGTPKGSRNGRKYHPFWEKLRFIQVRTDDETLNTNKSKNTYKARCEVCQRILSNTSVKRFMVHRYVSHFSFFSRKYLSFCTFVCFRKTCKLPDDLLPQDDSTLYWENDQLYGEEGTNEGDNDEGEEDSEENSQPPLNVFIKEEPKFEEFEEENPIAYVEMPIELPTAKRPRPSTSAYPPKKISFKDSLANGEQKQLDAALANFIFGCNIPFSVIESDHFVEFVKRLRPAYAEKMPGRKMLSNSLLNRAYENCVKNNTPSVGRESILLLDSWKNETRNTRTVVSVLGAVKKPRIFMNSSEIPDAETKDQEEYNEVIKTTIQSAKEIYKTDLYAAVLPEITPNLMLSEVTSPLWYIKCNSSVINSLAMEILESSRVTNCVPYLDAVLKELKRLNLDGMLVRSGGLKIVLPRRSSWTSLQDSFLCFMNNLMPIREILEDAQNSATVAAQMKPNIKALLYKEEFVETCRQIFKIFVEIYRFFQAMETASIATALKLWMDFEQNEIVKDFVPVISQWKNLAICNYHLVAHYLYPFYDSSVLSASEMEKVNDFLIEKLDGDGLEDWDAFRSNTGIFLTLEQKKLSDPIAYWNTAKIKHPTLAQLATKLLRIPATSGINRVSDSYYVYRNNLPLDKAAKLLHVYFTLRIEDRNKSVDY